MISQKRKILLLIDNCPAHPLTEQSNVKVVYLPVNTTSVIQPCDAGIIRSVKAQYRKRLLRQILLHMSEVDSASEMIKKVNVLDAIIWIMNAWTNVSSDCITKCFAKCGISKDNSAAIDISKDNLETLPEELTPLLSGTTWEEFVNCDNNVITFPTADVEETSEKDENEDDDNVDEETETKPTVSLKVILEHLKDMQNFALTNNVSDLLQLTFQANSIMETFQCQKTLNAKQTKINDFFKC